MDDAYLHAPATELLATHCCLCDRALVDAESVERGLGPTCAAKAGVGSEAHPADWPRALAAASRADVALVEGDAHKAANALTHRIGRDPHAAAVPHLVEAIEALGYLQLAATLAEKLTPVTVRVEAEGDTLAVSAELPRGEVFDAFVEAMRAVPGRRWDGEHKVNRVPARSKAALWGALRKALPAGSIVIGARVVVLGEVA